ncbi:MAG: hypothetical protein DRJ03_12435 [Chloroflexi bacterium]|nr:MAG: hypothetical protein DRJ03_12435 [Chloroflexota bacterium]
MNKQALLKSSCLALAFLIVLGLVAPASATQMQVTSFSVTPTKAAYYVGEPVTLNIKFHYVDFTAPTYNMTIYFYNSSDELVATLTNVIFNASETGEGDFEGQYTVNLPTEKKGSYTYTAKLALQEIIFAQTKFTINVESESIQLIVSWIDASQDRKVDVNEPVTFSIFIQWSFVNESKTATLHAKIGDNEVPVTSVDLTAGSGQASASYQTAFSSEGEHVISFELRDSEGNVLAKTSVTVTVGEEEQQSTSFWSIFKLEHLVIGALLVIIIVLFVKERRD